MSGDLHALSLGSHDWLQAILGLIIITDLSLLGAERRRFCVRLIALQGMVLAVLLFLSQGDHLTWYIAGASAVFFVVKGLLMPYLLQRTYKRLAPQAPVKPYVGNAMSVFLGLCGFGFSLWLSGEIGVAANVMFSKIFPVAFATVFAGLLLIVSRREALAQMFGYLVVENGIFILGVPFAHADAIWLELSILLDILAGVFIMGLAIHHIHRAFDSTDVDMFVNLRD